MKRKLGFLVLVLLFLSGCSSYQKKMVQPKVNIGGSNTIAVLFFDNFTDEYAISREVEQQIARTLSEYYRVIDSDEVEWALVRLGLMRGQSPNRDEAIRLGQMLQVDALVVGEVAGYFAPITQGEPYMVKERQIEGKKGYDWEITQNTRVMVSFTGRVMDTRGGNVIHHVRTEGEASTNSKTSLGWFATGAKPGFWHIPVTHTHDISNLRKTAISKASGQFTQDLMPTYYWQKVD